MIVGECRPSSFSSPKPSDRGRPSLYPKLGLWQGAPPPWSFPGSRGSKNNCFPSSTFAGVWGFAAGMGTEGRGPISPGSVVIRSSVEMVINVRRDRWTFFSLSASIGSACTAENISTRTEQVTVAHPLSPHHPRLSMLPSFFCRKAIYSSGAGTKIATDQPLSREGPSDQELPHAEKPVESSPELPLPLAGLCGDETRSFCFDKTPSRRDGSHRRRAL